MRQWIIAFLAATVCLPVVADVAIGTKISNLSFKDIRYLPRTLDDMGKPKAYVIAFVTNECPVSQRYMPRLAEMYKEYNDKGVQFVAINEAPEDTIMDMAYKALDLNIEFPVVKDPTGECAKAIGATRTPQVAILDADRVLKYRGRVDDQYHLGGENPKVSRSDLKEALDQVLAGKDVEVKETQAEGCAITYPAKIEASKPVTFAEHIAPIINAHCVQCHRQGGQGPFTLESFQKVAAKADMIQEVVTDERMPPWYAHPNFGKFLFDTRLNADERKLIVQWIEGGKQEGDVSKMPPAPQFTNSEWDIIPDVVTAAKQPNALPATGFVPYKYIFFPLDFAEDTWVQGIQIKSTNGKVLHHANLFFSPGGSLDFERSNDFLTGTVPGGVPTHLSDGRGMFIPKGAKLGLQIHYVTTGKMEVDTPRVALQFAKEPIKKRIYYKILDNNRFKIPAGAPAYKVVAREELQDNATVYGLFGHMHLRGRDMTIFAHTPDEKTQTLISMPNYSFDWQLSYYVAPDTMKLPKGTKLECVAHFDNSPFNPYNPDPKKDITYGAQTVDEMMQGFLFYTKDDENLDVHVDPKTGFVQTAVAANK